MQRVRSPPYKTHQAVKKGVPVRLRGRAAQGLREGRAVEIFYPVRDISCGCSRLLRKRRYSAEVVIFWRNTFCQPWPSRKGRRSGRIDHVDVCLPACVQLLQGSLKDAPAFQFVPV